MRIAVHVFDGITTFHLAVPLLVFGEVARQGLAEDWTTTTWSGTSPVRSAEGLVIDGVADHRVAEPADMLIFPSWPVDDTGPVDEVVPLIRDAHRRGAIIIGLCLGAFPVAVSGVLDGRAAVTHWAATTQLAAMCPAVEVRDAALYLDHGDVLTSAGTASALDACLHIVCTQLGTAAAASVARRLVVAPHRDGDQAQYDGPPDPRRGCRRADFGGHGVGIGQPRPPARGRGSGGQGEHERAQLHAQIPRGHRNQPSQVVAGSQT